MFRSVWTGSRVPGGLHIVASGIGSGVTVLASAGDINLRAGAFTFDFLKVDIGDAQELSFETTAGVKILNKIASNMLLEHPSIGGLNASGVQIRSLASGASITLRLVEEKDPDRFKVI